MKINTKLTLAVFIPLLLTVVVGLVAILSWRTMEAVHENGSIIREIRSSITELNHLTVSYFTYKGERPRQQFLAEQETMMRLIASVHLHNAEQERLLKDIRLSSQSMKDLFFKLPSPAGRSGTKANDPRLEEVEERLMGQLFTKSHNMDSSAARLRSLVDDELRNTQKEITVFILLALILTTAPLTVVLARMKRDIAISLEKLRSGTEIVGAGDLEHRIGMTKKDELGELARSFDQMTGQLWDVTVSKDQLQREVEVRRKAEAELRRQREWLEVTLTSIGDAVIATDADGRITFLNPVAQALTGWRREEAEGQPIQTVFRIINEQSHEPAEDIAARVLREGSAVTLANNTALITREGRVIPIEDSAAPIQDADGNTLGVILVFHDVTAKRHAQQAMAEHASNLEEVNRELESFSYSVSHDLRAPLRAIDGFSRMIMKRQEEGFDGETRRQFQVIRESVQTMGQIIDDLLAFSRLGRQDVSTTRLNMEELIRDVWQELLVIHPGRQLTLKVEGLPEARGDRGLIRQVYSNLLGNAAKFTKAGREAVIEAGSYAVDGKTVYYVRDNGVGFDMKFRDKLFGVFQRLHTAVEYEGTGIGLALVQRIIHRHGGRIWAEGKVDEGACFYFTLPD